MEGMEMMVEKKKCFVNIVLGHKPFCLKNQDGICCKYCLNINCGWRCFRDSGRADCSYYLTQTEAVFKKLLEGEDIKREGIK